MRTSRLTLVGSIGLQPTVGSPSGVPALTTPLSELATVGVFTPSAYTLIADAPVAVMLGGVSVVNMLQVKVVSGGHVRVRVTSADGATQAIPVDTVLILMTRAIGITAIDLTRDLGVETVVEVLVAQYA